MTRPTKPFTASLAHAIASALADHLPRVAHQKIEVLALDCHPWHGHLSLAMLTQREAESDPHLDDPTEMASWEHFDLTGELESWRSTAELGREMQEAYLSAPDPGEAADLYLNACAEAFRSEPVVSTLAKYQRTPTFRCSVAHPDDGREFVR